MSEALVPVDADLVYETTKARALEAHGAVMDRLISVLHGEDDKAALTAAGMLLKLGGTLKPAKPVVVNFQTLINGAGNQSAGPLAGITQIREAEIIDGDDGDDDN